jgi:zinc transport system substrate-binding protein
MILKSKKQKAKSKNIITLLWSAAILAALVFAGCSEKGRAEKQVITVSILPQKFWVEQIAGDRFDVQVMVPPGADSHTYEPSPKDMKNLSVSALYFSMGFLDFERTYLKKFQAGNPRMKIVQSPDDLSLIDDDSGHTGIDPHFWLSVKEVRKITRNMLREIILLDPDHADFYQQNYGRFTLELDTLDSFLSNELSAVRGRTVIIYHPALAYLARDYGFFQVSIEMEGKNPSAYHMKEIVDLARQENINTILIQKQIDREMAEGVAGEIKGEVEVIDPLAYSWMDNLQEIARMLNRIFQS